jgi:hypothetical protein
MFLLDDTSKRGSSTDDPVSTADRQFFSDVQRREALIAQAKINTAAVKSSDRTKTSKPDYPSSRNNSFVKNLPEEKKAPKDPKKDSKIDQAKSLLSKKSPDKNSALPSPTSDPRKMAAQALDEKIGLGRKIGHLLFIIWGAITLIGSVPFVIVAIPGLIMLNLLLISPKLAYKITTWLLLFIPGVGEAVKAVDEVGLGKVDISLSGAEKFAIICTDFVFAMLLLLVVVFLITIFCYNVNTSLGAVGAVVADWMSGTSFYSEIQGYCKGI